MFFAPQASIAEHLQAHRCLPFPAGPVLPRMDGSAMPLLAALDDLTPSKRMWWVWMAIWPSLQTGSDLVGAKTVLTGPVYEALLEWVTRHGEPNMSGLSLSAEHRNLAFEALPRALFNLQQVTPQEEVAVKDAVHPAEVRRNLSHRLVAMHADRRKRKRPFRASFVGYRYGCNCGTASAAGPIRLLESDAEGEQFVLGLLNRPFGEWHVLGLLFTKLLIDHLAIPQGKTVTPSARRNLYLPQLDVLRRIAMEARHPLAPMAAGLARALTYTQPYFAQAVDAKYDARDEQLPDWLQAHRPLPEASVLAKAVNSLKPVLADNAATWVGHTASLARELASLQTDPIATSQVLTRAEHWKELAKHQESRKKGESLAIDALDREPDGARFYVLDDLMPRVKRMRDYWSCMNEIFIPALDACLHAPWNTGPAQASIAQALGDSASAQTSETA